MEKIICDKCGKEVEFGNQPNGLPNGVGFELDDGEVINVCAECMADIGREVEETGTCKWVDDLAEKIKGEKKQ